MLDESSLASTKQCAPCSKKLNPDDRVLLIGDTRQHQGVDAGRPFEQMQDAGMQTSQLDRIMRQKDPELLKAVQHLATGETGKGVAMLAQQGRVTEVQNGQDRITAIARDYAAQPDNTIVISPDNRSRQQINEAIRIELRSSGLLDNKSEKLQTLAHRSDMTGADRTWAARYKPGEVLQYTAGSKDIEHGYTVESARHLCADRVLLTGENTQLAEQQAALTKLSSHVRDFSIYTSNGSFQQEQERGTNIQNDTGSLTNAPAIPTPSYQSFRPPKSTFRAWV